MAIPTVGERAIRRFLMACPLHLYPSMMEELAKRILVVEDDRDTARLLRHLLTPLGAVRVCGGGLEALNTVRNGFVPDVVVTDLGLPELDGVRMLEALRALPAAVSSVVIVVTGSAGRNDVVGAINAGARHYLTKPFRSEDLVNKVKSSLGVIGAGG